MLPAPAAPLSEDAAGRAGVAGAVAAVPEPAGELEAAALVVDDDDDRVGRGGERGPRASDVAAAEEAAADDDDAGRPGDDLAGLLRVNGRGGDDPDAAAAAAAAPATPAAPMSFALWLTIGCPYVLLCSMKVSALPPSSSG